MEPDPILEFITYARRGYWPQHEIDQEIANRTSGTYTSAQAYEADAAMRSASSQPGAGISGSPVVQGAVNSVAAPLPETSALGAAGRGLLDSGTFNLARRGYGLAADVIPGGRTGDEAKAAYDAMVEADRESHGLARLTGQGVGVVGQAVLPGAAFARAGQAAATAGRMSYVPRIFGGGQSVAELGALADATQAAARAGTRGSFAELGNLSRQLAPAAVTGAVEGGLAGIGYSPDEATLQETLINAGIGSATGGLFGLGIAGAGAALPALLRTRNVSEATAGSGNWRLGEAIRERMQLLGGRGTNSAAMRAELSDLNTQMQAFARNPLPRPDDMGDLLNQPIIREMMAEYPEEFQHFSGRLRTIDDWRSFHGATEKVVDNLKSAGSATDALRRQFNTAVGRIDDIVRDEAPEAHEAYRRWAVTKTAQEAMDEGLRAAGNPSDIQELWRKYDPNFADNINDIRVSNPEVAEQFRVGLTTRLVEDLQKNTGSVVPITDQTREILRTIAGRGPEAEDFVREVVGVRDTLRKEEFLRRISEGLVKYGLFSVGGSSVLGMTIFGG